jgi:uncharacterized protein involved in cysteine biosynthesis
MRQGLSAAGRGLRSSLRDRQVRRSYLRVALLLLLATAALDVAGIAGLWVLTDWEPTTSAWLAGALIVARILGVIAVLVVAPLVAIFVLDIVLPMFNEGPFLAGLRAVAPARAEALGTRTPLRLVAQIEISLVRLLLFLFLALCSALVSLVPVAGQIAGPILGTYFSARAVAWELLDPWFARAGIPYDEQVALLGRHHAAVVGFGLPFVFLFAVPIVGPLFFVLAQAAAATFVAEVIEPAETALRPRI